MFLREEGVTRLGKASPLDLPEGLACSTGRRRLGARSEPARGELMGLEGKDCKACAIRLVFVVLAERVVLSGDRVAGGRSAMRAV
jgi:hypothetical protein